MSTTVFKKKDQAAGQFNNGEILENKPLGFPQEGEDLHPFSNLFYWAHAWTPGKRSLIGEHPHQGFEILSYVLKGSIEHYDNKNDEWQQLKAGDLQVIRAGSGITHAEMVNEKSEFFQIWFDPNLDVSMTQPASYDNYDATLFPLVTDGGLTKRVLKGKASPLNMLTPGVEMLELSFRPGEHIFDIPGATICAAYLIDGDVSLDSQSIDPDDFILVKKEPTLSFNAKVDGRFFIITLPNTLGYKTYAQHYGL